MIKTYWKNKWIFFLLFCSLGVLPFFYIEDLPDKITYKIHRIVHGNVQPYRPLEVLASGTTPIKRRVFDCCIFFNELELLQIRLNELYDHVDYFVIVESKETHRGEPKPLNFIENEHLFEKFRDKIIYVPIEPIRGSKSSYSWKRENYQRNQIIRGLANCKDDDIILISDLDEIPKGDQVPQLISRLVQCKVPLIYCGHKTFRYFLNRWDVATTPWPGTAITTYKFLKNHTPQYTRRRKDRAQFPLVECGWHFTTMGGFQKVIDKYKSVVLHKGDDQELLLNLDRIRREASGEFLVPIDDSYPAFIQNNLAYFKKQGFIDLSSDMRLGQVWPDCEILPRAIPQEEPYISAKLLPADLTGWFNPSAFSFLKDYIAHHSVQTVVEIEPWLGLATQCFARLLPNEGIVYAVDTWTPEEMPPNDPRNHLAYEYFLSNLIQTQAAHKVVPIKADPLEAKLDICPQITFIGAFRSPEHVYRDIVSWNSQMKGKGLICGMHYENEAVKMAVKQAATELKLSPHLEKNFWHLELGK